MNTLFTWKRDRCLGKKAHLELKVTFPPSSLYIYEFLHQGSRADVISPRTNSVFAPHLQKSAHSQATCRRLQATRVLSSLKVAGGKNRSAAQRFIH